MKKTLLIAILALVAQMSFAQSLPSYVPTNGLVGYWGFDGNANDYSGNGNNGTVNGATLTTDRNGNANSAYSFDGINDYIDISNNFFNNGWNNYTINVWLKINQLNTIDGNTIMNTVPHGGFAIGYSYYESNSFYHFKTSRNPGYAWDIFSHEYSNSNNLSLNTFYHFTIIKEGLTYKYYINGVLDKTMNSTTPPLSFMCALKFGAIDGNTELLNGKLDDIAIYNRSLTQQEITQLYTATLAPTEVAIGSQTWSIKNLDVATYSDGTLIPEVTDPTEWANLTTGAWCYYNNDSANGATYGKLYNWYAVAGIYNEASKTNANQRKKLAPTGYHTPSDAEWTTLTDYLGGESVAGGKMKETDTANWLSPNHNATNSSVFSGLPGGYRNYNETFYNIGHLRFLVEFVRYQYYERLVPHPELR